ncbi:MAG TPA: murein biosynthesis integral membrane protein MurJ [Firmicutes bacterium]|nr:murein biosynthesis integral membrane protein MurJ [Bacillota bacterium]
MADISSSKQRVARAAGIVMFAIFLSRVLGFVRERAIATVFGRTWETDVFFAAFAIPDLMYQLLVGGVISSAFIPVFTQYLAKDDEKQAWHVASSFINLTGTLLVMMTILGIIFTPILAPLVGIGFEGEQRSLLVKLMRITFPAVFFTALSGISMGVLNSYQKFTLPAIGPLIYNSAQILSAYVLGPIFGIVGMAYGTVVGSFGSFFIQFPTVVQLGRSYYRRLVDFKHPGMQRMFKLMLPAILGLSIAQINMIVGQNLASLLETGSIVALRLANRLINFPLGIFAMGLSTAIFPTLARQAAKNEMAELKETFSFGLRLVFYITVPSAVGMAVLRVPIVRLLFETGEFTSQDTAITAYTLLFYSAGLIAQAGLQILTRVFYSLQDTVTPVKVGFVTVILNFVISISLLKWTNLDTGGLALAFSITSLIQMLILVWSLRKKLGAVDGRRILDTAVRALAAAAVMAPCTHYTAMFAAQYVNLVSTTGRLLQTFSAIAVGVLVYVIMSFLLRMNEPIFVLDIIKERLVRKRR